MKYSGILAAVALTAACSSNNQPPAASAASIDQASSTPSNNSDFAPVANDGTASAASDAQSPSKTGTHKAVAPTGSDMPAESPPAGPTVGNAAASPTQNPSPGSAADNSRVNARDKDPSALTPMDQGGSEGDRKITQQIRQAVMKDGSLSFTAKNVKIITVNGKVTLRGPVKTNAERSAIEAAAKSAAGESHVDNQLEIAK